MSSIHETLLHTSIAMKAGENVQQQLWSNYIDNKKAAHLLPGITIERKKRHPFVVFLRKLCSSKRL